MNYRRLARPGGNITGLSDLRGELNPKNLDMLLSMVPKLSRVAVLVNPDNSSHAGILRSVQGAAQQAGVKVLPAQVRSAQELEKAFSAMTRENAGAVIVAGGGFFTQHRHQIAELAAKYRLPSISASREYAEAGGLMSYWQNRADQSRHAATYVDKILKGARPADLPVEQPTKFELFINRKTANSLGLKIPRSLLISADKLIE